MNRSWCVILQTWYVKKMMKSTSRERKEIKYWNYSINHFEPSCCLFWAPSKLSEYVRKIVFCLPTCHRSPPGPLYRMTQLKRTHHFTLRVCVIQPARISFTRSSPHWMLEYFSFMFLYNSSQVICPGLHG